MYFTASVQAYDALTEVIWVVQVREWTGSDTDEPDLLVFRLTGQSQGEGLSNPSKWLRRVLEDIREAM